MYLNEKNSIIQDTAKVTEALTKELYQLSYAEDEESYYQIKRNIIMNLSELQKRLAELDRASIIHRCQIDTVVKEVDDHDRTLSLISKL